MPADMFMLPGIENEVPRVAPFLPATPDDLSALPEARPREVVRLAEGDTLDLTAALVRRSVGGHTYAGYAFNAQVAGPLIEVTQGERVFVRFTNETVWPNGIHWHGGRIQNAFDGVPGVTQPPVGEGESFLYELAFPDPGLFWYHTHIRADVTLGLGLFANLRVLPASESPATDVHREEVLILHDVLMDAQGLYPFGLESPTHALMGRFGNVLLVNGDPEHRLSAAEGEVVRFLVTNASNARVFNLSFSRGEPIKLVGSDLGRFERQQWTESVVIAPGERYAFDVRFGASGETALVNQIQALDHMHGRYVAGVDTLSTVAVQPGRVAGETVPAYEELSIAEDVREEVERLRPHFAREPDLLLRLGASAGRMPIPLLNFIERDTIHYPPVDWNDGMPDMNWLTTGENFVWEMTDRATGLKNMDVAWEFDHGDLVKLRIVNDPTSFHPMHHPIHVHGQRFLVLAVDGVPRDNLSWKDTSLIPTGATVDILIEMSNPGTWMLHCHILEHAETGMMMTFVVHDRGDSPRATTGGDPPGPADGSTSRRREPP